MQRWNCTKFFMNDCKDYKSRVWCLLLFSLIVSDITATWMCILETPKQEQTGLTSSRDMKQLRSRGCGEHCHGHRINVRSPLLRPLVTSQHWPSHSGHIILSHFLQSSSSTDSCLPQVHEGQGALPDQGSDAWIQPLPDCLQLVDVPGRMGLLHDRWC